ncbi:MAG: DegT/DnrJ/EryC1/StrS family aminotransferase, partial [Phycisphaerae bacterium]|nr:DegT/DnrJ/EryC1/StrS family aminotransferase [Phycisphaerae bacterium]
PIRTAGFPSWPVIGQTEDKAWMEVLHSGKWFRGYGQEVNRFEEAYAKLNGAKHCVATANGTSSLWAVLEGLGVGPRDEVILPPYTFIATLNVVLLQYALPIFVDSDPDSFQIDARKIEAAITERTRAIMPVHIGGSPADLDAILAIGAKHKIPVIEDACQAHLGQWRGRNLGSLGTAGCFSFQASKNLNAGEGGAILTDDAELAQKCYAFHNNCRGRNIAGYNFQYMGRRGANLRMTEFQAALLMSQMTRVEEQTRIRNENATYLTDQLKQIPGIKPAKLYDGCTRSAYHLYMFRYDGEAFGGGLTRSKFMRALEAEGIPCSSGYSPLNKEPYLKDQIVSGVYRKLFGDSVINAWQERTQCPANDKLCQDAIWFTQTMLLGPRLDMDHIVTAITKIHKHAAELAKA